MWGEFCGFLRTFLMGPAYGWVLLYVVLVVHSCNQWILIHKVFVGTQPCSFRLFAFSFGHINARLVFFFPKKPPLIESDRAKTLLLQGRIDKWQLLDLLKAIDQPPENEEAGGASGERLKQRHLKSYTIVWFIGGKKEKPRPYGHALDRICFDVFVGSICCESGADLSRSPLTCWRKTRPTAGWIYDSKCLPLVMPVACDCYVDAKLNMSSPQRPKAKKIRTTRPIHHGRISFFFEASFKLKKDPESLLSF